ncbi:MAG TPA: SDR family NAD(P)-dependent oxidoreductase [Pseudomonadales bacterium]
MQRFDDKMVLVTGAGSGIGKACAERLAAEGANIFAVDINQSALDALVTVLNEQGGRAVACCADVSRQDQVNAAVATCIEAFGRIDVVVNMAGILKFEFIEQLDEQDWQRIIDVNLTGTFFLCKAVLPHLVASRGNIVNAASTSALAGVPWASAYSASKGGVLSMTRSIAVEYAKRGVRANCVCPGEIHTPMIDALSFPDGADFSIIPRISSLTGMQGPEVVAGVVAMLASDDGRHITGEHVRVDGGTLS